MPGFPLDRSALHIAVDMQRLFAEQTEWFMPWFGRILPNVAIASHARFIPPEVPTGTGGDTLDPRLGLDGAQRCRRRK